MTQMYVQEYAGLAQTQQSDSIPVPAEPPLASYIVDYTAGVASGPTYQPGTQFLLVECNSIACMSFNGVAATITGRRSAGVGTPELIYVGGCPKSGTPLLPTGRASAITAAT